MAEEIYYYIMDKHGVIYGRSTSKTRLQEKMKNNFTEAVTDMTPQEKKFQILCSAEPM